jgi:DNA invertase Pin-like site-specific DNA recombinase
MKAAAYLRVSGQSQIDGDGFERQRTAIDGWARTNRATIVDEYRDNGISGTSELADRPGLAAIMDRVESNGVHVVIVERADRLARDLMVSEVILGRFRAAGCRVLTADGQDLTAADDPTRTLIRQVLGAVAQFDKTVTVLKLRAARDRIRKRTGRCEGRKPFGASADEQAAISLMRQLRRKAPKDKRRSFADVAAELNARGIRTRTGKPWSPRTVYGILERKTGETVAIMNARRS